MGVLAVFGLMVAGCSSSTSTAPATPATTTTTTSTASSTTSKPEPKKLPLAGKVVGIDPGHNGGDFKDPTFINHLVWNGREQEPCDTTGTATEDGYTEAEFNWNVASYLRSDLIAEGARVVMTRLSNDGVGPCVTMRAEIIDRARADVAIDIHADGAAPTGRGVTVLEPVADGPNDKVIKSSERFGAILLARYRALTGMPASTYYGVNGIKFRDDLAGLNLTTVPKVLIECGNMHNPTDAALLVKPAFQRLTALAFAQAITEFLIGRR